MAPSIDEFEDLTQFADESFDTGEVDLFEFADDEDSPLLRLKSIVLSLDWDITEEILNELNEELASLRNLWKDDKVAQIYLQGMENVGKYMRTEGAYAHPNAIKLLLTLYHNFEKIIASANISSESVTSMLKADIRKFKVLQYQISALKKAKGDQEPPPAAEDEEVRQESKPVPPKAAKEKKTAKSGATASPPPPPAKKKESGMSVPLRSMEATILGLEWEVTDEGLEKFSTEAAELRKHLSDNKEAQVLIQGLQALGAYIREQKTESHPDAFTILHSFYDALKMLFDSPDLGAAQRRQILIEQISSLNSLKEVIARSAASKTAEEDEDDEQEESEDEEAPAPTNAEADEEREEFAFGDEEDDDFSGIADTAKSKTKEEAPAPIAAPAAKPLASAQPPETSSDDDDEFDDDLFAQDGGGVKPALADEDEDGSFVGSLTSEELSGDKAVELDEKLDSFFNFGDEEEQPQKTVKAAKAPVQPEEKKPAAEVKKPEKLSLDNFLETEDEEEEDDEDDDIDSSFFNFTDDDESSAVAGATAAAAEDSLHFDDELFGGSAAKQAISADEEENHGLAAVSKDEEDNDDDELDAFFNFDDELDDKAAPPSAQPVAPTPALADEEESPLGLSAGLFGGIDDDAQEQEQSDETTQPALADEESEDEVAVSTDSDEIADGLDSFFSFDDAVEETAPSARPALADEEESPLGLSAGLFGGMDEDAQEQEQADDTQPALADEDEELEDEAAVSADSNEIADGLDSFFSFDEDDDKIASPAAAAPPTPALADEEESPLGLSAGLFGGMDEDAQEQEQSDDTDDTQPALADEDEEPDDEAAVSADSNEIADGLDSFFSFDDAVEETAPSARPALIDEEESPLGLSAGLFGGMDDDAQEQEQSDDTDDTQPALADEDEEPDDEAAVSADSNEIADGLDSFFSFDDAVEETAPSARPALIDEEESLSAGFLSMEERNEPAVASEDAEVGIDTARAAEIKNKLDTLFNFEDEGPSVEDESAADESFAEELPELADELITPLDDDDASSSGPAAAFVDSDDTLFGADTADSTFTADSKADAQQEEDFFAFGSSDADDEPVAAASPDTSAEESEAAPVDALAAESDGQHDAFFVFGDLDKESEEEDEPVVTDEDSALFTEEADADLLAATDSKSEEPQEEFFAFSGTESEEELPTTEEETTSAALLADDEQDELFSLKMEEESAEEVVGESEPEDDLLLGEEYEEQSGTALLFGQDSLADPFASVQEKEEEEASNVNVAWSEERAEDVDVAEIFSSLAAVAAALPSTPSEHHLRQVSELAAAARSSSSLPPHQAIVLDLLDTSSALLAKAPQTAVSGAIVQELAAGLNKAEEPFALAEMISHYTSWQKDFFSQLLRDGQHDEDVSDNVPPQSLTQLRQEMLEEFRQLRQEMLALRR